MRTSLLLILIITISGLSCQSVSENNSLLELPDDNSPDPFTDIQFPWLTDLTDYSNLESRYKTPDSYKRKLYPKGSFGEYLRQLPLQPGHPEVLLFNGEKKHRQHVHEAVFNIDPGKKDLQQCADAVMRLRAEYLWTSGKEDQVHFNFTSGDLCSWKEWKKGIRPVIDGNHVNWNQSAGNDGSYANFKKYLETVFTYAGSLSLSRELHQKQSWNEIESGDVIIKGGSPGHAVIVVDLAENQAGKKLFMIAQSYMPAQEIHLLKNFNNTTLSPWYSAEEITDTLFTPEYYFLPGSLMSFE